MADIQRFRLTVEVEINAPDLDNAMQYVYNGIRNYSDDASVSFGDGEEIDTATCPDCGEPTEYIGRCEDCQSCDGHGCGHAHDINNVGYAESNMNLEMIVTTNDKNVKQYDVAVRVPTAFGTTIVTPILAELSAAQVDAAIIALTAGYRAVGITAAEVQE